jgi:predicted HicB family RNase H-like nuclease
MRNVIEIDGHRAVVSFDPDIGMIRGEFLGLSGGADFYAESVKTLETEGRKSLEDYLDFCRERALSPSAPSPANSTCVSIPKCTRKP